MFKQHQNYVEVQYYAAAFKYGVVVPIPKAGSSSATGSYSGLSVAQKPQLSQ